MELGKGKNSTIITTNPGFDRQSKKESDEYNNFRNKSHKTRGNYSII